MEKKYEQLILDPRFTAVGNYIRDMLVIPGTSVLRPQEIVEKAFRLVDLYMEEGKKRGWVWKESDDIKEE